MSQQDFEDFSQGRSLEGKVINLVATVLGIEESDVSLEFNWKENNQDEDRISYFNVMIAESLTTYFNVNTSPEDVDSLSTVQDLVNRIVQAQI